MLTSYEITHALVAERQRDLLADAEHERRARPSRRQRLTWRSTLRSGFARELLRSSTRLGDATRTATRTVTSEPKPCL
jgi:hypothetical protein